MFFLFSGLECNDSENDPPVDPVEPEKCGEKVVDRKWHQEFTTDQLKEISTWDAEKKIATFSFSSPGQENVCPHEHVKVKIQVIGYNDAYLGHYVFAAEILYGIFFSYQLGQEHWTKTSDENYLYYTAIADFGIKPSAGDGLGRYTPFINLHITQREDIDAAIYDFEHAVYLIKIDWEHYKYMEPETR